MGSYQDVLDSVPRGPLQVDYESAMLEQLLTSARGALFRAFCAHW